MRNAACATLKLREGGEALIIMEKVEAVIFGEKGDTVLLTSGTALELHKDCPWKSIVPRLQQRAMLVDIMEGNL